MALARCVMPACPVRYASGPDRPCAQHRDDDSSVNLTTRASGFGVEMTAFDGDEGQADSRRVAGQVSRHGIPRR